VKRIEPKVTKEFQKNPDTESFLEKLNKILEPHQEEEYIPGLPEQYPIIHVIGVPRSGTTLLMQLFASHTDIGYINNLIAAFWRAPIYGIKLSRHLIPNRKISSYQSRFGRTNDIYEPHEYGYFWAELLEYREMLEQSGKSVNWQRVRLLLTNISHTFNKPVVFKSFLLGWHVLDVQKIMPKTVWVHVWRDPIQNALSLLEMRRKFLGSVERWASIKPKEYHWLKEKPYWVQVAGQVYFLEKRYRAQIRQLPRQQWLSIRYEQLCSSPGAFLRQMKQKIQHLDANIEITSQPKRFNVHRYRLDEHAEAYKIVQAWNEFIETFGSLEDI